MAKKSDNQGENKPKKTAKKDSSQPSNSGKFQTGHKKVGGRKAGTKNKVTTDLRKLLQEQLLPHIQTIGETIKQIKDPTEKSAAIAHWANYLIPKYSNTTINQDHTRDLGTEELLKQLESNYEQVDIQIDITKIRVHNNQ